MKIADKRTVDKQRKTYTITFPADLDSERVLAWLRSISGTIKTSKYNLTTTPSIVFELWGQDTGITHRLKVPWQHADQIISPLRTLIPGINVVPDTSWSNLHWRKAVEIGESNPSRPLRIPNPADMSAAILASVQALDSGEAVIVQWVVTPKVLERKPRMTSTTNEFSWHSLALSNSANKDEITERRDKLDEPNVMGVLRVAASASTDARAAHLVHRVRSAMAAAASPDNHWTRLVTRQNSLRQRILNASSLLNYPAQLSVMELASLIAWPIGSPHVAGLPQGRTRHLPATEAVARTGRVVGRSNFPGNERPLAISVEDSLKHLHILGPTGVGKTTLMANLVQQDIKAGRGVIVIESKGDLFDAALNYVPRERLNDVVIVDIRDTLHPVGFNILQDGSNPRVAVENICNLFKDRYNDTAGVWTQEVLYHGLMTLVTNPALSFTDLGPLVSPRTANEVAWRDELIRSVSDPEIKHFWQRFDNEKKARQEQIAAPVLDRIWQLNARPESRNIIGQGKSGFTFRDVLEQGKIVLINLAGLGDDTASLLGTLYMNSLWQAVRTTRIERPTFLYLDEFQRFIGIGGNPSDMLAQARSFGLGMTLAHQNMSQLPNDLQQAVLSNARSRVVFQTSSQDARSMRNEFGAGVNEQDFMNLVKYETLTRLAGGDGISNPMSMRTYEPIRGYDLTNMVRDASRHNYSTNVADVQQEMSQRRQTTSQPTNKRPPLSGEGWA
jgi:hypothetical protein